MAYLLTFWMGGLGFETEIPKSYMMDLKKIQNSLEVVCVAEILK